ncbi:uncharacterized protein LOC122523304 [Polistes fuscatus]|uniref:uncharacterized protein LOC122523304 n=1 Tax=Polistes fuscatus TaxID=30207 RepID=UPI001CA83555|nr:uncharacterized protein LOC122523304 [Polistes fuscatus]
MRIRLNRFHIILVLLFLPKEYRCNKCYQCNSKKDKDCTFNKVDPKYLKPCPMTHPYCRKYVYKYYFTNSKEYSTTRECAKWRNAERECYRGRYPDDSYQLTCECKGFACNRATRTNFKPLHFAYILSQLLVLLFVNYVILDVR